MLRPQLPLPGLSSFLAPEKRLVPLGPGVENLSSWFPDKVRPSEPLKTRCAQGCRREIRLILKGSHWVQSLKFWKCFLLPRVAVFWRFFFYVLHFFIIKSELKVAAVSVTSCFPPSRARCLQAGRHWPVSPSARGQFGRRAHIPVVVFFYRGTCHATPCNWMCWQHNDIGRWQKAAEHEAERCLVCLDGDALVSEVSPVCPKPHKDVRKSARWKQCNITVRCSCICGVRCQSLYNLPHSELLYPLKPRVYKKLITSFITIMTICWWRWGRVGS